MDRITKYEMRLKQRLDELKSEVDFQSDERATVVLDQQSVGRLSRMDSLQRQQMAKETQRRRQLEQAKIIAALQRLEEGEFGWCAECGGEIGEARLDINPTAHLCIECAR